MDIYADPEIWPTVTVNGNPGKFTFNSFSGLQFRQEVAYTFTCEENVVDRIVVDGITAPKKGQAPDYSPILGNADLYQLDTSYGLNGTGIYWYDCEGRQLEAGEVFGDAGPYRMAIKFVPVNEDGAPLCTFANDVDVMINGKYVTPYGDWDDIMVGSGAVWAFYTFRNATSAPEAGYLIQGTVTSEDGSGKSAKIELLSGNSVIDAKELEGDSAYYLMSNIPVGTYTLKVTMAGYITHTAVIEVSNGNITLDIEMKKKPEGVLLGDVNQDGVVNAKDSNLLKRVISGQIEFEKGTDEFIAADVDFDASISAKDSNILTRVLSGMIEL